MTKEDYSKYYIQGSDHYLIPKDIFDELFNEMNNWKEESKELKDRIDKAVEYIEKDTRWFDSEYASIYGTLCTCAGAKDNRLEVMVNPSNLLKILKEVE